uniref:GLUG motif-containing protein n=1 Tax=Segatella sp. TaxID=2974253 RepID=UPI00307AB322
LAAIGGVCGLNETGGIIENSFNEGTVSGTGDNAQQVGGVSGYNNGTIKSCYNTASVSGQNSVGGVCGFNSRGIITNCFNEGTVSGQTFVGGVCGNGCGVTTTNCFNGGTVSGQSHVSGVCGYDYNYDGTLTNCYYLSDTATGGINGKDVSGKAEGKSIEQFKSGEVAWLLNGSTSVPTEGRTLAWYQKLGENADAYPVLKSTGNNTVYQAPLISCNRITHIGEYANKPEGDISHNYQMAETPDEGTSNLYSEKCAICHNVKDGTKYIKDFCGIKDNNIKLTESDGSYTAAAPVDIKDNAAYDSPVDFTAPTLNYTRNYLGADQWQAVYVPFETQATDWTGNDITVASINNFHEYEKKDGSGYETVLEVKKATSGAFEANTPYLLRTKDSGSKTITINNAKLHKASSETYYCMSMTRQYDFTGIYTPQSGLGQDESSVAVYALNKQGLIAPLKASTEVGAQRWYLTVSNRNSSNMSQASKSRSISIDEVGEGATTAIKGIQVITNNEADNTYLNGIYDLQGRKLSKEPTHGIYIKNGKKYVK